MLRMLYICAKLIKVRNSSKPKVIFLRYGIYHTIISAQIFFICFAFGFASSPFQRCRLNGSLHPFDTLHSPFSTLSGDGNSS